MKRFGQINLAVITGILLLTSLSSAAMDPVAHWVFDWDASDIAGGFDGTFLGDAAITNAPFEYRIGSGAATFDGYYQDSINRVDDDGVATPYRGISGAGERTTCAWFKSVGSTGYSQAIFGYGGSYGSSGPSGGAWGIWLNDDGHIIISTDC